METVMNTLLGRQAFSQSDVPDLQGRVSVYNQTAIVTGGTGGIGLEVARALAHANARVLLLSRSSENAEKAISEIKTSQENGQLLDVAFVQCDLGNLAHVAEIADRLRKEKRLDLLFCNDFAVNHLGHFLLVNRLLPLMRQTASQKQTPAPRIVCMSSSLHSAAPSDVRFASVDEINTDIGPVGLYARSKLANLLFVKYGLLERVLDPARDRILALATHPGAVHTGQQDQFKEAYGTVIGTVMKHTVTPFMRDAKQGCLSMLWAGTSEDVEHDPSKWNGKYITDPGQTTQESDMACDPELGKNLWILSEQLVRDKLGAAALLPWDEVKF